MRSGDDTTPRPPIELLMPSRLAVSTAAPPSTGPRPPSGPTAGDRISAAASRIRRLWSKQPAVGLILGSGLHHLADAIKCEVDLDFSDVPGLYAPTATGHRGRLLCGTLAGLPVVGCQGRLHGYEGYDTSQLRFPIRLFDELGCGSVILSNAAGGVNPDYRVGDVMIVDHHLDTIGSPSLLDWSNRSRIEPQRSCYDKSLADIAYRLAIAANRPVRRGTYAALNGPNYETRAEYRMLRTLGVDAVGMSTAPEADEAHRRGLTVLALSIVTNACDPDDLGSTTAEAVIDAAEKAETHVRGIVWDVLSELAVS